MRALPYVGVVLLWAVTVAGVVFVIEQSLGFDDALIEGTRTPIPGQRTVHLDARKYNLFFEARDIPNPDRVGDDLSDLETSPLRVRIRAEGSDRVLALGHYSGSFTMSGDRDSTAFATVRVPSSGRYRVSVTSSEDLPYSTRDRPRRADRPPRDQARRRGDPGRGRLRGRASPAGRDADPATRQA